MIQPDTTKADADDGTVLPDDTDTTEDSEDMADMTTADTDDADARERRGRGRRGRRHVPTVLRRQAADRECQVSGACPQRRHLRRAAAHRAGTRNRQAGRSDRPRVRRGTPRRPRRPSAALGDLLARKPHLASRRPAGDIGQGASPVAASSVDLAALLRQRAR